MDFNICFKKKVFSFDLESLKRENKVKSLILEKLLHSFMPLLDSCLIQRLLQPNKQWGRLVAEEIIWLYRSRMFGYGDPKFTKFTKSLDPGGLYKWLIILKSEWATLIE